MVNKIQTITINTNQKPSQLLVLRLDDSFELPLINKTTEKPHLIQTISKQCQFPGPSEYQWKLQAHKIMEVTPAKCSIGWKVLNNLLI